MADLIRREHYAQTYKGTVLGPVSNEKFTHCHFEDCLILECHTCRFDGCTFLRCTTTSFTESVITFCNFDQTDVRMGRNIMLQDCILQDSDITDESKGFLPSKMRFYSTVLELMPFTGRACYINGNRIKGGEIKLKGNDHIFAGNFVDETEQKLVFSTALTNGPVNL